MSTKTNNYGIVYVLTNPVMPDLVKIGMTNRDTIDARMKELFTNENYLISNSATTMAELKAMGNDLAAIVSNSATIVAELQLSLYELISYLPSEEELDRRLSELINHK